MEHQNGGVSLSESTVSEAILAIIFGSMKAAQKLLFGWLPMPQELPQPLIGWKPRAAWTGFC